MATKSFFEVLEEEIRKDLRKEIEAEVRARVSSPQEGVSVAAATAGERLETWLTSRMEKTIFSRAQAARRAYPKTASASRNASASSATRPAAATPSTPIAPRAWAKTAEELFAHTILYRHGGCQLPEEFTEVELKAAWRKAALKTHPDRFAQADQVTQAQMAALFREIVVAFETLSRLFSSANRVATDNARAA